MTKLKPFQLAIVGVSIFLGVLGLFAFAFLGPKPGKSYIIGPQVTVWGTLPQADFDTTIQAIQVQDSKKALANQLPLNLKYVEKDPATFQSDLLQSIAAGQAPDVVLLPLDSILQEKSILMTIPFTSYPERTYKDTFIEEGDLFAEHDGYFAIPFAIDPMVLFYNKTILTQSNIVSPPQYWDEVISEVPKLTTFDADSRITTSAISLGEYRNVTNSKGILSALLLQSGTPIVTYNFDQTTNIGKFQSSFYAPKNDDNENTLPPSVAVVDFFTQFADPTKPATYTWSRALPDSEDYFASGDLALYLGFGSEVSKIEDKNPNLNFDISFIPQDRSSGEKTTYGNLYGLSILKNSANAAGAFQAITSLSSNEFLTTYDTKSGLPPVRRDLLANVPTDANSPILYESALKAKGWLDPDPEASDATFMEMIESVLSGRNLPNDAAARAEAELEVQIEKINTSAN